MLAFTTASIAAGPSAGAAPAGAARSGAVAPRAGESTAAPRAGETTTAPPTPPSSTEGSRGPAVESNKETALPDDTEATHNAARARTRECGHQWSSMKKNGQADGMTWKDFSQSCLARK